MRFFKRKHIVIYFLFSALALLMGYSQAYYLPLAKKWIIKEVNRLSLKHLPLELKIQSLEFGLLPPRLIAHEINATPTGSLAESLAPLQVEQTEIKLNWVALLLGQVRIGEVKVIKGDFRWVEKTRPDVSNQPTSFDLDVLFRTLAQVPIERLVFESLALISSSQTLGISAKADPVNAIIENHGQALFLEIDAPTILVKETGANRHLDIQVETRALLDTEGLKLSRLKLRLGESFILGSGFIRGRLGTQLKVTEADLMSRFQLDLSNLQHWLKVILPQQKLPALDGMVRADVNWKRSLEGAQQVTLKTQSQNLSIEEFIIGSIEGEAELQEQAVHIKEFSVSNSAGEAQITNGQIQINDQAQFAGRIKIPQLELAELLKNLKIPNLPLKLNLLGDLSCSGHFKKTPVINCTGDVEAPHLHVWTPTPTRNTIVKLNHARANGSVHITDKAVTYDAQIKLGTKSQGHSRGAISYKNGFKIDFSGSPADLSDVEDLAGLNLQGVTRVSGQTEGDSHQARFNMSVNGKGLFLRNYFLGDASAKLDYAKSRLRISDIQGQIGRSPYSSLVEIDFNKDRIHIDGRSPKLDLTDLKSAVSQVVSLPFEFHGAGSAEIKLWGPFELNRLNYNFKSTLLRGDIAKESFDQLFFNVTAVDGRVQTDRVQALKAQSTVDVKGHITSQGEMDLKVLGSNLRLEESENLTALGFDVNGRADLDMNVKGPISDPQFDLSGKVTKVVVGDFPADDSSIQLKWDTKKIEGEGQLLGQTLVARLLWPFADGQPFDIQVQSSKWDFARAFSLVSSSARQNQFDSSISGLLKLSSPDGSLKTLEGAIDISEVFLSRGPLTMAAKEPFKVRFINGVVHSSPVLFEGSAGTLRLNADGSSVSRLKADLTGKMDLALGVLFTPFLSDLRGQINLSTNIQGSLAEPAITGSAYIEDGFAKLEPFPQPFEKITADVLFSQKDVVINTLKGTLGGGPITGDGRIRIMSSEQVPIDIKGQFNNVSVHFPENVRTRGSGLWQIKGGQKPYLLSLNYGIQGGEVTTEFGGGGLGEKSSSLNTAYLPKFVATSTTHPLEVDVHLSLDNNLPVRNSLLDSQIRGSLRVQGPTDRLLFTGSLNPIPGGKIFFRETPFEILSGYVEYQGDTVDMAKIYISGQAQVIEMIRDENDREVQNTYQIQLIVQGRANNPKITLSSLPPMDQKEIASLLALGMTPASLQSNRSAGQLATSNSMQLGSAILQKPLSKEVKKRLGFDVQLGQAQSSATNADTLQVTIGRQFTPNFSATASRTLEQNPRSAARAEVKVNKNISVIGSWQTREGALEDNKDVNRSIFGMDFEYKVNFK